MTILVGVIGVANGALLAGWLYFGGVSMAARNLRRPRPGARHALNSIRRYGGRHRPCRISLGCGGVLAVLLAGRAAAVHRAARGRYLRWRRCTLPQRPEHCSPGGWRYGQRASAFSRVNETALS